MPNVAVLDMTGKQVGEMTLSDAVFGAQVNEAVLHAAVRAYLMNQRQGTQSTLTRAEVSGGGKKPWRQKGTGRARQGSIRSPQWTHGGIALGPKPRDHRIVLNKKARRAALFSALSAKVAEGSLVVVDDVRLEAYRTREMVNMFEALGCVKQVENLQGYDGRGEEVIKEKKTRTEKSAKRPCLCFRGQRIRR